jgi:multiple sugar transport system ATP-binding protein
MGDRIAVMNEGRIHQVGTPDELYDFPVNRFVASFIGTPAMGFLDCRIQRSENRIDLVADSTRIRIVDAQAHALRQTASQTVIIGIRPEQLSLASDAQPQTAGVMIRGKVEAVEMPGAEQYVHVEVRGGGVTARVPRSQPVKVEDTVTFVARARDMHLFDPETGQALR